MSQISQVKEATDILEIIGERIELQHSGSQWRGLCPFHSEKSPSFFVSDQFQRYKCFGCGENGDVFTFLEKYEGMTFAEALQTLAERAGITLTSFRPTQEEDQQRRLLEILSLAKEYYHFLLTKHEAGQVARDYLKDRGITQESIRLFQIGYSLPNWDGLLVYLRDKKKYALRDLQDTGLLVNNQKGNNYDRFRGRVMFPLTNHRGQVVGFSGRVLDKETKEAKYINSPETKLYHKSEMLFGYSELLQEIRKKKEVVVVEGEFDVISSAQAHVNNVVAIKGSALSARHLQLISRVAEKVLFSLDMDAAGVKATKRAIELNKDTNLEARVIIVPNGKDPDELARKEPAAWREAVKNSVSVYEYLLQAAVKQFDPQTPEGKRAIIDELAPVFAQISHAVERDVYIKKLSQILQVRESLVRDDLEKFKAGKKDGVRKSPSITKTAPEAKVTQSRRDKMETYLLHLLLTAPKAQWLTAATQIKDFPWEIVNAQSLVSRLDPQSYPTDTTIKSLPEDLRETYFEVMANPELSTSQDSPNFDWKKEWSQTLQEVKQEVVKQKMIDINQRLTELDRTLHLTPEQEAEQMALLEQIVKMRQQLQKSS